MKLIAGLIKKYIRMFLIAVLFLTFEAVADLLQPALMAKIVDNGVKNNDTSLILRYGAIMLLVAFFGAISAVVRSIVASKTSQQMGKELRSDLYKKVQTLSFENIDRLQPASIITRITNDVTQIQNFINGCMRILVKAPITCIGAVTLVIIQSPKQAPVMGAILLISGIFIYFNMRFGYPRFGFLQQKLDKLNNVSRQFLSSIRVVKAFGAEEDEEKKFSDAATELSAAGVSSARVGAVFGPLINLTVNMGVIALLLLFNKGETQNIGKLMASVNYMTQVLFALGMVSNILNMSVRATASANRVKEIFDEEPVQKLPEKPITSEYSGDIVFENLSFKYSGSQKSALGNINIHINKGETIGIIGSTGSGKTSLVNLIPRFYDATEGKVLIDGIDVTQADINSLRKSVACVPQRSLLFSGTIKDNLKWGDINADDTSIKEAAKVACADSFIQNFPDGYETVLGQGGVNLSGGQKQRISIARALIRRPNILILDDCTSALDATTEDTVLRGIKDVSADMTVLLISQRISTVMKADRVLCLEDGSVKGFGTHEELMSSCETYKAIYRSQIGGAF